MEKIFVVFLWISTFTSVFTHANEGSKSATATPAIPKKTQEVTVQTPQASWCKEVTVICDKPMNDVITIRGAKIEGVDPTKIATMYCINQGLRITVSTKDGKKTLNIPEKDLREHIAKNDVLAAKGDFLVMNEIKPFRPGGFQEDGP